MKNNKGITLIALIITILVMLILAAVSINMTIGENGIIIKAEESAKDTEEQYFYEIIMTSISYEGNGKFDLNKTSDNIKNNIGTNATTEIIDNLILEIEVIGQYGVYEYTIGDKGNALKIPAVDYGKVVVNYKTDSTGYSGTWEILYADDKNVYLISKDSVKTGNVKYIDKDGMEYNFTNVIGDEEKLKNFPAIKDGWIKGLSQSGIMTKTGYRPTRATMWLLDIRNWENYKDSKYASWVIGAPTVEMLITSNNKKYEDKPSQIKSMIEIDENGYKTSTTTMSFNKSSVYNLNPYYKGYEYWLACPSNELWSTIPGSRMGYIRSASNYGSIDEKDLNNSNSSNFRPVVCLKSSVVLEPNEYEDDEVTVKNYRIK